MEELVSSDVRVVLSIKEGKGFDRVLQPTSITATLDGYCLEAESLETSSNPQYEHDLVWEVDKQKLRKMRSGQVPLKLECFASKSCDSKEKLGYLLLSLRSAQIIPRNSDINVKATWHKLLGLKTELKVDKPELLLTLCIHEPEPVTPNTNLEPRNSEFSNQTTLPSNKVEPILLHEERLIQLGPLNTCHHLFLMSITAVSATNISFLLPKEFHVDGKDKLDFCCQVLENDIYFTSFKHDSGETWTLNEKIVVRIRSSLRILKEYLQLKPYVFIYLKYKDNIVGQSEIDLQPLIPTDNIEEFLKITQNNSTTLDQRCILYKKGFIESNQHQHKKSCVNLQLKLQYLGKKTDLATEVPNASVSSRSNIAFTNIHDEPREWKNNFGHTNLNEIDYHRNPAGDFGKHSTQSYISNYVNECQNMHNHSSSIEVMKNSQMKTLCPQSGDAVLCECNSKDCFNNIEAYHCYCLNVLLMSIKLSSSKLTTSNIEIRFHHPKTEIVSTFQAKIPFSQEENIKFQDIGCKLHFISAAAEIKHLLSSFPPKISLFDLGNTKTCVCQCTLDVKYLFTQNKFKCQCDMPLYDTEQNKIGDLVVMLSLEDHGPYYRVKRKASSENLGPPILDDSLAYKIVDELETWKDRQKEMFKVELKKKEDRHLNLLSEEWQKHRENLESKLACSVEQCKMLANSLNNATEDLRTRRLKSLEKEARLIKANEDLQWRYETKIQELKESFRTMQDELTSKIEILEKKKIALESQVEPLTVENERLKSLVAKQSEELEVYQKGSLTQDQTATLLQELKTLEEKLHNAQDSKSFFKEQWAKAVREIHRMKTEHQQAIQVQIKNSKEELQNLDLGELLCTDSSALTNDQILLGQIQREIDVIKPKPAFIETDAYNQVFTPHSVGPKLPQSNRNKAIAKKSGENDERLQTLIEERDSLLKTGSYTIDDSIIIKLNTEIRSLMMR